MGLQAKTASGVAWSAVTYGMGLAVQVGAGVVLARVLAPADFGTAGLALVIAGIIAAVNQFGIFASIVQRRELTDRHYNTALTASVVSGAVFGAGLFIGAGALAAMFRNPGLVPVLRAYSLLLFFGGLSAIQSGLLSRELLFREKSLALLASRIVGSGLSIALVLAGRGVMSIAWGCVAQSAVAAVQLSTSAFRVRKPRLGFSPVAFRELFGYGSGVMGATLLDNLASGLDVMLVGRLMGAVSLGFYSLASQTASYLPKAIANILPGVIFPAFARVQDSLPRLRQAYLRLSRVNALVAAPMPLLVAALAPDIVPAVFGPKWSASVVPLQALALASVAVSLDWVWAELLKAQGRSARLFGMTAVRAAVLVPAILVGAHWGITGVAAALVAFRLTFWLCWQAVVCRGIGVELRSYARAVLPSLGLAAIAGTVAGGARALLLQLGAGIWVRIVVAGVSGALALVSGVLFIDRNGLRELLNLAGALPVVGLPAQALARRLSRREQTLVPARPRAAIITTVHRADDTRIFHKQARTIARAGWDVTLLAPRATLGLATDEGVTVVGLSLPRARLLRMTIGAARALTATLAARPDVCHFHDPELLPVGLVLRILGKRVIYDVHEDYPEQILAKGYIHERLRRAIAGVFGAVEKWAAARLDAVVAATDTIARKFHESEVITVRNYPLLSDATPPAASRARSPSAPPSPPDHSTAGPLGHRPPFRLVHLAGTLTEERGITGMVKAMDQLGPWFELVLAGRFVPAQYEAVVRALPGFRSVRHIPAVPHERIGQEYSQCDAGIVCLMPVERYKVSLPVKLFEFMAAGLPVIASDFPLFREIVEGSECGICVDPTNPEAIAAAVRRLAGDPAAARRMGEHGITAVSNRYNWHPEGAELVKLYGRIGRMRRMGQMGQMVESGRLG